MNKVYAWYPAATKDGFNVGHASLDISFGQGFGKADYVSWWPTQPVSLLTGVLKQAGGIQMFPQDCQDEGGNPGGMVEIRCLDEDRMRARWGEIKRQGNYSLYFRNCAFTVVDILRAGGADLSADVRWFMGQGGTFWTPWSVIELARKINAYANVIEQQRAQGWRPEIQNMAFLSKLNGT